MTKPSGYYSKKDRHGQITVHPIFESQRIQRREPRGKIFRVATDLHGTVSEFTPEGERKGTIPFEDLVKMKKDGVDVYAVSEGVKSEKFKKLSKETGIKGYDADKRRKYGKDLKGADVYIGDRPIDKKRAEEQGAQFVQIPAKTVKLKLTKAKVSSLQPSHMKLDEDKVQNFVDAYKCGKTIPPPLVHKLPDGTIEVMDGHHRIEAQRRMGVKEIPVVENSLADTLRKVGHNVLAGTKNVAYGTGRAVSAGKEIGEAYRIGKDKHLEALIGRTESPNKGTRIVALARIRREYPDLYEEIYREFKRTRWKRK